MKKYLLIIGCALAAFADRIAPRALAVNEAPAAPIPGTLPSDTPVVTVGLPTNLDPTKILDRKKRLIAAGTEPLLAEKLAIDAEQQQYLRDNQLSVSASVEERTTTEKVLVIKTHPDGEPEEVNLTSLSIPKLTAIAEANSIDLKGARRHADIVNAILGSAKTSLIAICCALFFGATSPAQASVDSRRDLLPQVQSPSDATATVVDVKNHVPPSAVLAYLRLDAIQTTEAISAIALAVAACAWLRRKYRSWGAHFRYLIHESRKLIALKWRRALFRIGMSFSRLEHIVRGRALATNIVFTPQETSHGTVSLDGTAAIATKNYVVVRGADDRHFKLVSAVTDVPLGILLNEEIATDEVDAVKKNIALFGLWPESLPAVAEAAIAVDAWLTPGVGTFGRVKALPTTPGIYWVVGKSRFAVANAGDPVSIAHCMPFQMRVGVGYVTGEGGAVAQITSSATGVTLNKLSGQITTVALTTAAGAEERFAVTDSMVAAGDTISFGTTYNGAGTPMIGAVNVGAGTFDIVITNLHAANALNAAMVINFAVVKAAAA